MNGYKFLTAKFIDNERLTVEALWVNENDDEIIPTIIQVKEGDAEWENLTQHITLDELHENTYQGIKSSEAALKEVALQIAKEKGWVIDIEQSFNSDIYRAIVKGIFVEFDPNEHKEQLFLLKLELFELDSVKACKDKTLKSRLRKAPNIIEAVKAAIDIVETTKAVS